MAGNRIAYIYLGFGTLSAKPRIYERVLAVLHLWIAVYPRQIRVPEQCLACLTKSPLRGCASAMHARPRGRCFVQSRPLFV